MKQCAICSHLDRRNGLLQGAELITSSQTWLTVPSQDLPLFCCMPARQPLCTGFLSHAGGTQSLATYGRTRKKSSRSVRHSLRTSNLIRQAYTGAATRNTLSSMQSVRKARTSSADASALRVEMKNASAPSAQNCQR